MKNKKTVFVKTIDWIGLYALKGLFFLAPFVVTYWALDKLARFILKEIEILLIGVPHKEIISNNWWYALAFGIALFVACLFGFIASRTILGRNVNDWSDKTMKKVKGVGQLYAIANDFIKQFEEKNGAIGKPVIIPTSNPYMLQVGHIMSNEKILLHSPALKRDVVHCSVIFKSAYGIFSGSVFLIPEELINEHESHYTCNITPEEASLFVFSGGTKIPQAFIKEAA